MHEIDTKIKLLDESRHYADAVVYGDFMEDPTAKTKTYATIVGNPPFVRTKRGTI
jgi:methylase of polypeptide subunit release factors